MTRSILMSATFAAAMLLLSASQPIARESEQPSEPYEEGEIVHAVSDFFEITTEGAARAVERIFSRYGRPNAYIAGEEGAGAFILGLRYGKGVLYRKGHTPVTVYWQGPSVGFDIGANASKSFTLVYNLPDTDSIFQRFPGVEGTYYLVAGIGVNYQQNGDIILAPMRTGVGLRAGVNAGYLAYSRERNWVPL